MLNNRVITFIFAAFLAIVALPAAAANPTSQQYTKSFAKLYQKAQAGDPDAEYAVGYMYFYGKGTPKDAEAGISWIHKAAAQGQPLAIKALQILKADQSQVMTSAAQRKTNNPMAKVVGASVPQKHSTTQAATVESAAAMPAKAASAAARSVPPSQARTTPVADASTSTGTQPTTVTTQATTTQVAAVKPMPSNSNAMGSNAERLMALPATDFTIQLTGGRQQWEVTNYIKRYDLQGRATYYRTTFEGKPWYVLIYGQYQSAQMAQQAIQSLPEGIQRMRPWVKPLTLVQANIRQGNPSIH